MNYLIYVVSELFYSIEEFYRRLVEAGSFSVNLKPLLPLWHKVKPNLPSNLDIEFDSVDK